MLSIVKTYIKITFITCIISLFLSTGIVSGDQNRSLSNAPVIQKGIINSPKLNLRKKPTLDAGVVMVLTKGETVEILKKKGGIGGWLTVRYKGRPGYIRNRPKYIKLLLVKKKRVVLNAKTAGSKGKKHPSPIEPPPPKRRKTTAIKKEAAAAPEDTEQKNIALKIQSETENVKAFTAKEMEIIEGLDKTDYTLNQIRIKAAELSEDIKDLEQKNLTLTESVDQLTRKLAVNRDYAGQRLKALYKMNMIGRLDSTGLPDSLFDFFLMQNAMKKILQTDYSILESQSHDLKQLETLKHQLQEQITAKTHLEIQLRDQIRMNKKETEKKQMVLEQIRQKKRLSQAAVASLKQAARQLDHTITGIQSTVSQIEKQALFSAFKGRLNIPVRGKIISRYGPSQSGDYKAFTFQKGIDIKTERGEPVKSVFQGEVMFAQWLKGYGNLLIINHGESYYTLYAHVEEIFKQKGERVETGEVIATAGDTGSMKGLCLHFEVRHHGKPVNPMKWLKQGA